jgi:hypothetical protein
MPQAEFTGSQSGFAFEIPAEKGRVGEIQLSRYGCGASVCVAKKILGF